MNHFLNAFLRVHIFGTLLLELLTVRVIAESPMLYCSSREFRNPSGVVKPASIKINKQLAHCNFAYII